MVIPSVDDASAPLVADANGTIPSASAGGLGFVIYPVGNGAAFPVTARLGKSRGGSQNIPVFGSGLIVQADGFEQMEIRGAKPGSTWMVYTVTDPGDDVRASIGDVHPRSWELLATSRVPANAKPAGSTTIQYEWIDWAKNTTVLAPNAAYGNSVGAAPAGSPGIAVDARRYRKILAIIRVPKTANIPSASAKWIVNGLIDPNDYTAGPFYIDTRIASFGAFANYDGGVGMLLGQEAAGVLTAMQDTTPGLAYVGSAWAAGFAFAFGWGGAAFTLNVDLPCYLYGERL